MSRSRRSPNPAAPDSGPEPFPNFPSSPGSSGPSSPQDHVQTSSTTTTTTTVIGGRNNPVITTTSLQPGPSTAHSPSPPTLTITNDPNVIPYSRTEVTTPFQVRRRPIGIRRLPSATNRLSTGSDGDPPSRSGSTRGRSTSAPQAPHLNVTGGGSQRLTRQSTRQGQPDLPTLREEASAPQQMVPADTDHLTVPGQGSAVEQNTTTGVGRRRSLSNAARSIVSKLSSEDHGDYPPPHEYETEVVDLLDVIDPEVSALTTLTNVQNSLFVPDLGRWVNRRPTYTLSRAPTRRREEPTPGVTPTVKPEPKTGAQHEPEEEPLAETPSIQRTWSWQRRPPPQRSHSISSEMTDSHYAVLPHGVTLDDWSEEDKEALDDHVRHMLHSKRSKFKQSMKAFGKYVSTPLGFFVTLYATLITLFGLAWVLFLIGWIYAGNRKDYLVNVIDNVLVALFAVMGDGLAPFRIVDTYHMIYIVHYHMLEWNLRKEKALPKLQDHNDLPLRHEKEADPESQDSKTSVVLTPIQQKRLIHHQTKFAKSHTYYKPHETVTHHAFPIKLLITCVVLLDCHSLLQISLGTFTWAWSYHTRPEWITSVILSISITVNISAGIIISIGDRKTRKKDVILRMTRQELTSEAIKKVKKHKADRADALDNAQATENFEVIREEDENGRSHSGSGSESFRTASGR